MPYIDPYREADLFDATDLLVDHSRSGPPKVAALAGIGQDQRDGISVFRQ